MEQRALFNDFPNFMYNNMANKAIVDLGYYNMIDAINDFKEGKLPQLHDILSSNVALADDSTPLRQPISKRIGYTLAKCMVKTLRVWLKWIHTATKHFGLQRRGITTTTTTCTATAITIFPIWWWRTVGGDENSQ